MLSIIKRRDALGLLTHSDLEERFTNTRSEIVARIQIAMGGLVAEETYFGEASTGPAGDLQAATAAAVSGANTVAKVLADQAGRASVDALLDDAKAVAERLIRSNGHILEALRDALLTREELVGEEILEVVRSAEAGALARPAGDYIIDLRDDASAPDQLVGE